MESFLLIVFVVGGAIALMAKSARTAALEADVTKKALAVTKQGELDRHEARRAQFLAAQTVGWAFLDGARVDLEDGLIAMDAAGTSFRVATIIEQDGEFAIAADEIMPVAGIRSITVAQPVKPSTRTHVDRVPVAVQNKRSTVGRAVVGTMVAGPLGTVVGALSAGHGGTTIEHHKTHRTETTYVKGDPLLVIATGGLAKPTIRLRFADAKTLNVWSARLWAARGW